MKKVRACLCLVVIHSYLIWCINAQGGHEESNQCTLPNGSKATCIPIRQCPKIVQILEHYKRLSMRLPTKVIEILRKYNCGYDGTVPLVCCPTTPKNTTTNAAVSFDPPDVSNHRNINLINDENCGISSPPRIVGGTKADLSEFPWMALISYKDANGKLHFRCDGSLISPRYVLTAAHCFQTSEQAVGVRLGEHDIKNKTDCQLYYDELICAQPVQDILVEKIISHPGYTNQDKFDDIGLIKLATAANLTPENVKPVCLPVGDLRNNILTSKNVLVSGWGSTETGYSSEVLLKVQLPVMKFEECRLIYEKIKITITQKQICAGGVVGKDSCKGDSGGPLVNFDSIHDDVRYIQYGVVSFGPRLCGQQNQPPGVYTRVANYMDWILNNMEA